MNNQALKFEHPCSFMQARGPSHGPFRVRVPARPQVSACQSRCDLGPGAATRTASSESQALSIDSDQHGRDGADRRSGSESASLGAGGPPAYWPECAGGCIESDAGAPEGRRRRPASGVPVTDRGKDCFASCKGWRLYLDL
jgi:hypothetical protein